MFVFILIHFYTDDTKILFLSTVQKVPTFCRLCKTKLTLPTSIEEEILYKPQEQVKNVLDLIFVTRGELLLLPRRIIHYSSLWLRNSILHYKGKKFPARCDMIIVCSSGLWNFLPVLCTLFFFIFCRKYISSLTFMLWYQRIKVGLSASEQKL